ncbi:MAG: Na+/H+ antiporter subunit E [Pseudomonadota bacterium]
MNLFLVNLVLALMWAGITASFHPANLLFGFLLGYLSLWLARHRFGEKAFFGRSRRIFSLLGVFLVELIKSGAKVAAMTLAPGQNYSPGIVAIPLSCDRDIEITLLANMISLTPGTLSIDVSTDRSTLYVHAMDVDDPQELIDEIKATFERRIMLALRDERDMPDG